MSGGPSGQSPIHGIAWMVAAMFVFGTMDAVSKILAATYPTPQILWVRFIVFFLLAAGFSRRRQLRHALRSRRPYLQVIRSLVLVLEIGVYIVAFRYLPLADVAAIAAAAPLLVTALAAPVLGEKVGPRRWVAVLVGFLGVLIVVRPGFAATSPALLIPLAGAILFAVYQLLVRVLAASDSARTTVLYTAVVGLISLSLVGPFYWHPPDAEGWLLLLVVGLLGAAGHAILIKALQLGDAAVLQPFSYTHIVFATIMGYLVFGDLPDRWVVLGAVLICAGGLFLVLRRPKLGGAAPVTPPRSNDR